MKKVIVIVAVLLLIGVIASTAGAFSGILGESGSTVQAKKLTEFEAAVAESYTLAGNFSFDDKRFDDAEEGNSYPGTGVINISGSSKSYHVFTTLSDRTLKMECQGYATTANGGDAYITSTDLMASKGTSVKKTAYSVKLKAGMQRTLVSEFGIHISTTDRLQVLLFVEGDGKVYANGADGRIEICRLSKLFYTELGILYDVTTGKAQIYVDGDLEFKDVFIAMPSAELGIYRMFCFNIWPNESNIPSSTAPGASMYIDDIRIYSYYE